MDFKGRRERLREKMEENGCPLIIITSPDSIYYYTGFHGALGIEWGRPELFLMTIDQGPAIITPSMEEEMAYRQTQISNIRPWIDGLAGEWREQLIHYMKSYKGENIGVDYYSMPHVVWDFLTVHIHKEQITDITPIIEKMRMIKDKDEIQIARHTGEVATAMLEGAMKAAVPGVREFEVSLAARKAGTYKAAELMQQYYADENPFNHPAISSQQIMATGEHTTMCHHRNSLTKLVHGEPLFICHCGSAHFKGFNLGFDRTLFIGEINDEVSKLLDVAEKSQQAALSVIKPGAVAEEVFKAYAGVIEGAGYPIPFRAGRAVGFSVNEAPQLAKGDETILEEGMVFAVDGGAETGQYRTQVGDSIVVTKDGCEILTPFTNDHESLITGK